MAKVIKVDKNGMVLINNFEELLDVSKVAFYSLRANKDKTLTLKFYDNKKKLVKPYEKR
jgi:hypothetical protein